MTEKHPSRQMLARFMRGDLEAAESQEIVLHLLSGCESCREAARESFPCDRRPQAVEGEPQPRWREHPDESYAQVFERVVPKIWESEVSLADQKAVAPMLVDELMKHPHERRLLLIRNSRRFQSWPVCDLLLNEAFQQGFKNPSAAVELARLGVTLAESLEVEAHGAQLLADLQARAHGVLANALRITGDLRGAAMELTEAEDHLGRGTGDQVERARLLEWVARLAGEKRDYSSCFNILNQAISIYRTHGEKHRLGRVLISKGFELAEKGDVSAAIESLREGLQQIDTGLEPRLALVAKHNLVHYLYETGRYHQALALVPETLELHAQFGNDMDMARFEWLQARICRDSGDLEAAEASLGRVKRFFVDRQIAHDAALVSLDLAVIYLHQRRTVELKGLAAEMLTIFRALRIHREAMAALVLFQKAVELERATVGLVRDLAAYLKNSRHDPYLPFRPGSTL